MDYRNEIIRDIARRECGRICRKVIYALQRITEARLSGDDSGLATFWDELCVQVQYEESECWHVYQETIDAILQYEVDELSDATKQAIWLQTDEGCVWDPDDGRQKEPPFNTDTIAQYVFDEVLSVAGSWRNKRITRYLDSR